MKNKYGFFVAVALALGTFAGMAETIANLNTGVDGNGASLGWGATDLRWSITTPPPSSVLGGTTFNIGTPPIDWGSARYISPWMNNYGPLGNYSYEITFNMTKMTGLTYSLDAAAWADDSILSVTFGGSTLTPTKDANNVYNFVFSDQSLFHSGDNTLMLVVNNREAGAIGLILTGSVTAVPEASEWAMLIGAAGLGLLAYRKKLVALMQRETTAAA
jgi:hypothetical protein